MPSAVIVTTPRPSGPASGMPGDPVLDAPTRTVPPLIATPPPNVFGPDNITAVCRF